MGLNIQFGDVSVTTSDDLIATVEIHRPPSNFFDVSLVRSLADAYQAVDEDGDSRVILLCSEGKHFCAGADFNAESSADPLDAHQAAELYAEATRLFSAATPSVAAVQGAAIGGGLGLACSADFRVACPEARFAASFARLGLHQGFGLSVTLPAIVGPQKALDLLLTARRVGGEEAHQMQLCDRLVPQADVRAAATELAVEIAVAAPLAVRSIRQTMRAPLADAVRRATAREDAEQARLRATEDFAEGIRASGERRLPNFTGR